MNEQTLQKLKQMKLLGMARAFATSIETGTMNQFTTDEMIAHLTVSEWDDVIGDSTLADAILDRLVHEAHRMELIGDTLRRKQISIY